MPAVELLTVTLVDGNALESRRSDEAGKCMFLVILRMTLFRSVSILLSERLVLKDCLSDLRDSSWEFVRVNDFSS
jgi:hypothetical protein